MRRALALAVILVMLVPALAVARGHAQKARVPSAQLQSAGSGAVTFAGRFTVTGNLPERGILRIVDRAGDARVVLQGEEVELVEGRARVRRAQGILFVTGSNVRVTAIGRDVRFSVAGNGRGRFAGSGVYRLNGGPERAWNGRWVRIGPRAGTQARRARR